MKPINKIYLALYIIVVLVFAFSRLPHKVKLLGAAEAAFTKDVNGNFFEVKQVQTPVSVQELYDAKAQLLTSQANEQGIADRALGRVAEIQKSIDEINARVAALIAKYPEAEPKP